MPPKGYRKTHCKRGHARIPDNLGKQGHCLKCNRQSKGRWSRNNPDYWQKWKAENPEKVCDYRQSWVEANPEKSCESKAKYAQANPEKIRANGRKRRALKKSQLGLWDDDSFIERQLWLYQNGKCFYCPARISHPSLPERDFHLEHCTPLTRGGKHCASNVVLSCVPCNLRKGTKTAEEFLSS